MTKKENPEDAKLVELARRVATKHALSDEELAAVAGCSVPIARALRICARVPVKPLLRARVSLHLAQAALAADRASLRLAGAA